MSDHPQRREGLWDVPARVLSSEGLPLDEPPRGTDPIEGVSPIDTRKRTPLPQVPHYACIGVSVLWDAQRDMCVMIHGQQSPSRGSACFPLLLIIVAAAVGIGVIVTMFF